MAIYYMNVQVIGRSTGRTATGAAAYRARERIEDERTGQVFDYTRRRGDISTEIMAPAGAPEWVQDREQLWNRVELAERRADAQVAREVVVALPRELDPQQQWDLVREYVQDNFVSRGMVADVAIHRNPGNPHAHIMLTMREIGPEGFAAKKNRDWNRPEALEQWRAGWADRSNRALERAGHDERIDHRSLVEQGSDRLPQVHLGPHAASLEQRGIQTDKGDQNRLVAEHNGVVIDLAKARAQKRELQAERNAQERAEARIKAGWSQDQARALARLEASGGGGELAHADVRKQYESLSGSLAGVQSQLGAMNAEDFTLTEARFSLDALKVAQDGLKTHETLMAAIKRIFSKGAQEAYQQAQERFKEAAHRVDRWGVRSEAELAYRRAALDQLEAQRPRLENRENSLKAALSITERALQGFEKQAERERQAKQRQTAERYEAMARELELRERKRDRGIDRGR